MPSMTTDLEAKRGTGLRNKLLAMKSVMDSVGYSLDKVDHLIAVVVVAAGAFVFVAAYGYLYWCLAGSTFEKIAGMALLAFQIASFFHMGKLPGWRSQPDQTGP